MTNLIHLLPDHVANQIAAGEVIQRPASVIKELVENAIDAGATAIKVIVKDAGKTLIQVIDNGCGMNEFDARMSFERHATSKIRKVEDIFQIFTKGFRGEALASIAAVAQVELKTKMLGVELGSRITVEGSVIQNQETVACSEGTSFAIKNLYFNTPARRNFLKNDSVELKHIVEEFLRVALVHQDVKFELIHNELSLFNLPPSNAKIRIVNCFGENFKEKLVPFEQETSIANVKGFICKPSFAKRTRGEQYFFVNNRFIKSNYLNHAITNAYGELIDKGSFPSYFVFLDVDPSSIDINIHPTKTEIKFQDEKSLYAILNAAIKKALGMHNLVPSIDFNRSSDIELTPVSQNTSFKVPQIQVDAHYNPFAKSNGNTISNFSGGSTHTGIAARQWQDLMQIQQEFTAPLQQELELLSNSDNAASQTDNELSYQVAHNPCIQIAHRHIACSMKNALWLIDQQGAHERILYDRFLANLKNKSTSIQKEMFPVQLKLSPSDYILLSQHLEELKLVGVELAEFGNNTLLVNGLPADSPDGDAKIFIESFLEQLKNYKSENSLGLKEKIALSLAKSASIKHGKKLSQIEMQELLKDLFHCEQAMYSPRGKAIVITLSNDELIQKFT